VRFKHVRLRASERLLPELREFYARLGTGETELEFAPGEGEPFYHFAFLVPPVRFSDVLEATPELLPDRETGEVVFEFEAWDARAFYFHDPAGNIVELIALEGIEDEGLSELGLVGDPRALAQPLAGLGLELWDGTLDEPGRLAFLGERGRTLILAPEGRGWLPTGRPAEPHPVEAVLSGPPSGRVELENGLYVIERA
jgi:catechol 2,3-dioxygenase-like lactoylglutathione lyase family enzyme